MELQDKLSALVEEMPAFSSSVTRIMELTSDINCAPKDMVEVIDHDPVMTVKILKLVNSAYFGLRNEVVSIKQGVVLLGINTLKNLALTIAAVGMLPRNSIKGFDSQEFLLHSLGTATVARILSQKIGVPPRAATDYFVAGLLHDFGKVVLVQFVAEEMEHALGQARAEQQSLHGYERAIIGFDHSEVGGELAKKWGLPKELVLSIREHHEPDPATDSPMRDCVIAANLVTKKLAFGNSGNPGVDELPETVQNRFANDLDGLLDELGDLTEALDNTRVFASA
jgi:putative nucleotidyltransferase with HDIG domain